MKDKADNQKKKETVNKIQDLHKKLLVDFDDIISKLDNHNKENKK